MNKFHVLDEILNEWEENQIFLPRYYLRHTKGGGGKGGETLRTFKYSLNVKTILKKKSNRLIRHFASLVVLKKGSQIPYHLDTPLRKSNRLIRAIRFARSYKKGFPNPLPSRYVAPLIIRTVRLKWDVFV